MVPPTGSLLGIYCDAVCLYVCLQGVPHLWYHPLALCSVSTVTLYVCMSVCRMCPAFGTTHWLSARYLL